MRIGGVWDISNARHYRAIDPLMELERRGHEVVWPASAEGQADYARLRRCDVVLVYRRSDTPTQQVLKQLSGDGVAIVFDNDDNQAVMPKGSVAYEAFGGLRAQKMFSAALRVAQSAAVVTTTCEPLAELYRNAGVADARVIPNQLRPRIARPSDMPHDGVIVGWVAGGEHRVDAQELGLAEVLATVLDRHRDVHLEMVGFDLKIRSDRYHRTQSVPFDELPRTTGRWDIGLAPVADLPFNRTRSDIKVKEYAGSGVAWLASARLPYAHLGEREGGLLVDDDGWIDAIGRLVVKDRLRRKLAKRARKWARGQTVEATVELWERALRDAAAKRMAA